MKYIAIIETSDVGARYTGLACRRLGYEPLFLFQKNNYQADTLAQLQEFPHIITQTNQADQLSQVLINSPYEVVLVTTFLDSRLAVAAELSNILGIPGLPLDLIQLKDKHQVYLKAPHLFPPSYEFNRQYYSPESLIQFQQKYGKIILKPRNTAGGLGMQIVSSSAELISSLNAVQSFQTAPYLRADEWMVQSFKEGQLISLEGYVAKGKVHCWGATGRKKVGNTESMAYFPHEIQNQKSLNHAIYQQMKEQVVELFKTLKIENTFFHIEFIVTENGKSYIIDPNIGRIGGGGLLEVLSLAFKISPIDVCEFILRLSLLGLELEGSPLTLDRSFNDLIAASTLMYGSHHGGCLNQVQVKKQFPFYHTQILNNDTNIPAMGTDNWSWVGILSLPSDKVNEVQESMNLMVNNQMEALCF